MDDIYVLNCHSDINTRAIWESNNKNIQSKSQEEYYVDYFKVPEGFNFITTDIPGKVQWTEDILQLNYSLANLPPKDLLEIINPLYETIPRNLNRRTHIRSSTRNLIPKRHSNEHNEAVKYNFNKGKLIKMSNIGLPSYKYNSTVKFGHHFSGQLLLNQKLNFLNVHNKVVSYGGIFNLYYDGKKNYFDNKSISPHNDILSVLKMVGFNGTVESVTSGTFKTILDMIIPSQLRFGSKTSYFPANDRLQTYLLSRRYISFSATILELIINNVFIPGTYFLTTCRGDKGNGYLITKPDEYQKILKIRGIQRQKSINLKKKFNAVNRHCSEIPCGSSSTLRNFDICGKWRCGKCQHIKENVFRCSDGSDSAVSSSFSSASANASAHTSSNNRHRRMRESGGAAGSINHRTRHNRNIEEAIRRSLLTHGSSSTSSSASSSGGNKYIYIKNIGKRKIRYYKNGKPYVLVKGKKIKI